MLGPRSFQSPWLLHLPLSTIHQFSLPKHTSSLRLPTTRSAARQLKTALKAWPDSFALKVFPFGCTHLIQLTEATGSLPRQDNLGSVLPNPSCTLPQFCCLICNQLHSCHSLTFFCGCTLAWKMSRAHGSVWRGQV